MKPNQRRSRYNHQLLSSSLHIVIALVLLSSCGRESSPEGRMGIKLEELQKRMMDSMRQQNRAILDSLGEIRQELDELKQVRGNF